MRIILNTDENLSPADLISMIHCARYALIHGLGEKPGSVMLVTHGRDSGNTFGVVRTKTGVSVLPPVKREPSA